MRRQGEKAPPRHRLLRNAFLQVRMDLRILPTPEGLENFSIANLRANKHEIKLVMFRFTVQQIWKPRRRE